MARGVASPAPNPLPKVSFVKVTDEFTQKQKGVHDGTARAYGYNNVDAKFTRPPHYIRYIEPLESDLATQVEYDMDEQDQEWLDAVNTDRKAQHMDKVTYETFEVVMDRLEKEWFDLSKNIPKTDMGLPSEESSCAICDDSEGENTNAIVFCDGCNLAVHQDCYGVPYIPEGQWLCRKCTVSPEVPVECILCPNEGGAFKQTVSGDWVHLLCAIWVPETGVANDVFMEPITGVEKISKPRWRLRCSVCDKRHGACIQCTKPSCFIAFHATCARKEKLLMPMKATQGSEAPTLACFCEKHLPREQMDIREAMLRTREPDDYDMDGPHPSPKSNKTARAYAKTYKPGPPLVPKIMVNRIIQYISRIQLRHKPEFVHLVCRYWSLKREARRGAPLLKRLHLEPWTALSGSKQQTDEEKTKKLDHMKRLRDDLDRLRVIAGTVRRREAIKREQVEAVQNVLLHFFFPHEAYLRLAFEKIIAPDRQDYFKSPVSKSEVPDYYDVIKHPMCWDTIDQKLDRHEYLDLAQFKHDINLVLDNAVSYNEPNTQYYKTAVRIRSTLQSELASLESLVNHPPPLPSPPVEIVEDARPPSEPGSEPDVWLPRLGDLEPSLDDLELLVSEEAIRAATNLIITTTPVESLLNFELPLVRPPAPPPPPPAAPRLPLLRKPSPKQTEPEPALELEPEPEPEPELQKEELPKRKRKVGPGKWDRKAHKERKERERQLQLDRSPGFRAPRTRGAAALEIEVGAEGEAEGEAEVEVEAEAEGNPEDTSLSILEEHDIPQEPEAGPSTISVNDSSGEMPKKKRQRRQKEAAPEVEDVNSWDSFKKFETGWILPPVGRHNRPYVERGPVPPPRKRAKKAHNRTEETASAARGQTPVEELVTASAAPGSSMRAKATLQSRSASEPAAGVSSVPEQDLGLREASPAPPGTALPLESASPPEPSPPPELTPPSELTPPPRRTPSPGPIPSEPTLTEALPPDSVLPKPLPTVSDDTAQPGTMDAAGPSLDEDHPIDPATTLDPQTAMEGVEPSATERLSPAVEVDKPTAEAFDVDDLDLFLDDFINACAAPPSEAQSSEVPDNSEPVRAGDDQVPMDVDESAAAPAAQDKETTPAPHALVDPDATESPESIGGPDPPANVPSPSTSPEPEGPRRIIIIEELDTPLIRRQKNAEKRAARDAKKRAAAAAARGLSPLTPVPSSGPVAGPSRLPPGAPLRPIDDDDSSDLTNLSGEETETDSPRPKKALPLRPPPPPEPVSVVRRRVPKPIDPTEPGVIVLKPGERVEGGTLVWAKMGNFPWWPAVVFEQDDREIPANVLASAPETLHPGIVLVRFYEKRQKNNWAWLSVNNIRYLGEDNGKSFQLDSQMLATTSKYQRWRNSMKRMECRNAYKDAMAEMEGESEAAAASAGPPLEGGAPQGA